MQKRQSEELFSKWQQERNYLGYEVYPDLLDAELEAYVKAQQGDC